MRRLCWAFFVFAVAVFAANVKLYMKDGSYQIVREYGVKDDRVRFYSIERSDWEEVPLELVDIKRTETEVSQRKATLNEEAKVLSEEDRVERQLQDEITKIPQAPGVYYLEGGQTRTIKLAESAVRTNKGRAILKAISPVPMVSGKATLELQGKHALNVVHNPLQEFYIQLSTEERFGMVKLTPDKDVRVVEKLTIVPVSKEVVEEPIEVEIFRKQLTPDGLYKIWPMEPFEPGEYAVIQYTAGTLNMQVWDFAYEAVKK
jgi:hypothetical protein